MSAGQLKMIALGLAVLLLVWGGTELFSRGSDAPIGSLTLSPPAPADVDEISVVKGADSVLLARPGPAAWSVNGHRAALASVTELFQALGDTVHPELVAQDASSFARLQVDSATGRWLRLRRGGKPVLEIIVGAHGSDFQSVYLRQPGDAHVYLWRGRLASLVDRSVDDWRDKRIAALQLDSIAALDVQRGKDRYTLRRTGKTWSVNGAATDSTAVARYLERLKTITAAGFATAKQVDSTKTARATRRLDVRRVHGVLLSLAFDSTATGFVVRHLAGGGGEPGVVYRMNSWDVDGVTPASRSLLAAKK